jgi:hypothetical protein
MKALVTINFRGGKFNSTKNKGLDFESCTTYGGIGGISAVQNKSRLL